MKKGAQIKRGNIHISEVLGAEKRTKWKNIYIQRCKTRRNTCLKGKSLVFLMRKYILSLEKKKKLLKVKIKERGED